ncbi:MAG TPA: hypothetical protein V6D02_12685 [Candidatus Obscuribacterales bacterium]
MLSAWASPRPQSVNIGSAAGLSRLWGDAGCPVFLGPAPHWLRSLL